MLSVIMLSVIMLSVIMLNVIILNVMAPFFSVLNILQKVLFEDDLKCSGLVTEKNVPVFKITPRYQIIKLLSND